MTFHSGKDSQSADARVCACARKLPCLLKDRTGSQLQLSFKNKDMKSGKREGKVEYEGR